MVEVDGILVAVVGDVGVVIVGNVEVLVVVGVAKGKCVRLGENNRETELVFIAFRSSSYLRRASDCCLVRSYSLTKGSFNEISISSNSICITRSMNICLRPFNTHNP